MNITIEMPAHEIAALKQLTGVDSDAEAIAQAAREFLRVSRLRELKAASGSVEFGEQAHGTARQKSWASLEELWRTSTFDSHGDRLSRDGLHERH